MSFFQTNFYPLLLLSINSSSTLKVSQETLSEWCHTIVTDGKSCKAYYDARSNNETYTHHDKIYKDYADTLHDIFNNASGCNASTYLILIQTLQQTLSNEDDDHFGETFMKNYDYSLQDILTQALGTTNGPLIESRQMKQIAFELLLGVLGACRPFESLSWATERLYDLDWSEHHDEGTKIRSGVAFVIIIESYGQSVLEALDPLLIHDYVSSLLTPCTMALSYIDNTLRHASSQNQQDDETLHLETLTIINAILDLTSFCYDRCASLKKQETDTLLHMANYLLLLVFDKFVLNVDLDLSNMYYERFHSRYVIKGPNRLTNNAEEISSTKIYSNEMMDCISRCLGIAMRYGITFDKLLSHQRHLGDSVTSTETTKSIQSAYPFSCDGIVSMLAISLFDRYLNEKSTDSYLFPTLVEPLWIGRHCLGMVMNLIRNPQDTPRIDKSLLILLYLADNVDDDKMGITLDDLDKEFYGAQNGDQKVSVSLVQSFQMLTSMTSMADDPKLRFLGHQLIAQFIQLGHDETRLFILTELLENCPYSTMRTAAIGLLKNQVDQAFQLLSQQVPPTSFVSPFCTKLLFDKFLPMIYDNQVASSKDCYGKKTDQDTFWEKYSYHMQALNFYYYLMIRDYANNVTCIWEDESIKWMKSHYLEPLEQQCALISKTYRHLSSSNNGENINCEIMQLTLMTDMIDQIHSKMKDRA